MNRFSYFFLFLILLIGSWLRISGILTNSFAFTYDVGRDLLAVQQIVENYKIPLIGQTTGLAGVFYGPWWYYILAIPYILSSGNPQFVAMFIATTGILTALLGYILGKKIDGIFLGLLFASLLAFSPVMIGISSQIWNPNLAPLLVMILLLVYYKIFVAFKTHKNGKIDLWFLLTGILCGLLIDTEIVFGILLSFSLFISLVVFFRKKLRIKQYLVLITGVFFMFLPRVIFDLRHDFLMTKKIISLFTNSSSQSTFSFSLNLNTLSIFENLWKETVSGSNTVIGIILFLVIFSLLRFSKKISDIQAFFLKTTFIIILVFYLFLEIMFKAVWGHYIVGLPIFFILLLSLAITVFKNNYKKFLPIIIISSVLISFISLNPVKIFNSITSPLWEGNAAVYRNQVAVIKYIYEQANGKRFNYAVYTPPIHDFTYRYLFSWYGKKNYGYVPSVEKESLFFLIMEPDYEHPFRLKDWREVRKDDGKILKEEIIKGGIAVQSRVH